MSRLPAPAAALAVALIGVGLAWLAFKTHWLIPVAIVGLLAITTVAVSAAGRARIPHDPVRGVRLMAWRAVSLLLMAGSAAAVLIAIGVWLEPAKDASTETKKLLAASVAALTAFITALSIKKAENADEAWIAKGVKSAFEKEFRGRFAENSRGQRAVFEGSFEGNEGWGPSARRARADAVAAELKAADPHT